MSAQIRRSSLDIKPFDPSAIGKLCLIAGGGSLPYSILNACDSLKIDHFVVPFMGNAEPSLIEGREYYWSSPGQAGKIVREMKRRGVTHMVFAGHLERPSLKSLRLDFWTFRKLIKIKFRASGDNFLLNFVSQLMEKEGFTVLGAHEICPDLLGAKGRLGKCKPDKKQLKDIEQAKSALEDISKHDIGQSLVVQDGMVLGVEAIEGTDKLIERVKDLKRSKTHGPILVKMAKSGQNENMDMPTIGLNTVQAAYMSGFSGIAFEADKTLILDSVELIDFANKHDIFVIGV